MTAVQRVVDYLRRCTPARVTLYLVIYVAVAVTATLLLELGGGSR